MALNITNDGDHALLTFDGSLTIETVAEYQASIRTMHCDLMSISIDLSSVDEIDSCGLQLLVALDKKIKRIGMLSSIVGQSRAVRCALQTSRLDHVL